ncbi:MAG: alpha/beta hydrolase [Deinococcota bacterium]
MYAGNSITLLGLVSASAAVAGGTFHMLSGMSRRVEHHVAENDGLKTHYVSLGRGPLVVLIHGIPEFWYSWRKQIEPLAAAGFRVVAIDQRGFNRSDKPSETEGYASQHIVKDVAAVIRQEGYERAHIVGHDSGALAAWLFATIHPEMTDKLTILSVPHPNAFAEELATNPAQHKASEYARKMQRGDLDIRMLFRVGLLGVLRHPAGWLLYTAADIRTDHRAVSSFYEVNYPREPYTVNETMPKVRAPTLVIHGRKDRFLLASGHAHNSKWTEIEPETVMLDAGHFVQQEKAEEVNRVLLEFLTRGTTRGSQ